MDGAFQDLIRVWKDGIPAVLATVVRGRGPTYRKPGASAVITADLQVLGAISGGCLEQDILAAAKDACGSGEPRLLSYDTGSEADLIWGTGSGCGGQVDVLVAPVASPVVSFLAERLERSDPAAVASVISGPALGHRLAIGATGECAGHLGSEAANHVAIAASRFLLNHAERAPISVKGPDGEEIFIQPVLPAPLLVVIGAGDDARPVVGTAKLAGFRVVVVDHRPAWLTADRFPEADQLVLTRDGEEADFLLTDPDTRVVIMSHQFQRDLEWLRKLLASPVCYVGLLGARLRSRKLVETLLADNPGIREQIDSKLHAPVGLDIGADGPGQIAISIVAELLCTGSRRSGRSLSTAGLCADARQL